PDRQRFSQIIVTYNSPKDRANNSLECRGELRVHQVVSELSLLGEFLSTYNQKISQQKKLYPIPSHLCAFALFFSVFTLLSFVLHCRVVLLVLASSSFRVSSSGHVLYHSHRRPRVSVVVGTYENRIGSLPQFYFRSFQKFLLVSI
ncbi:Os03g0560000, partial [Oryza sativa Japonica Group]